MEKERELLECKRQLANIKQQVSKLEDRIAKLEQENVPVKQPNIRTKQDYGRTLRQNKDVKTESLENKVGKSVFSVVASLLILIGVGIFISTIYDEIPKSVKVAAIYGFGFALIGIGTWVYRKTNNKFWLGVTSSGTAELLVSVIASYSYFKIFSLPVTYVMVFIWVFGTYSLTKLQPALFKIISYVGFVFSTVFGICLLNAEDGIVFIFLFISYVVLSAFFIMTNKECKRLNIGILYSSLVFLMPFLSTSYHLPIANDIQTIIEIQPTYIELWPWLIVAVFALNAVHLTIFKQSKLSYCFFSLASSGVMLFLIGDMGTEIGYLFFIAVAAVMWGINLRNTGSNHKNMIYEIPILIIVLIYTVIMSFEFEQCFMLLLYLPFAVSVFGLKRTNDVCTALASIILFFGARIGIDSEIIALLIDILVSAILFALMSKQKWGMQFRNVWYVFGAYSLFALAMDFGYEICNQMHWFGKRNEMQMLFVSFAHVLLAIVNLYRIKTEAYDKNYGLKKTGSALFLYVCNSILIFLGLVIIDSHMNGVIPSLLAILSTFAVLSVSIAHSVKTKWMNSKLTMLHCIKYTAYCWFIMISFDWNSIIVNIIVLLLAIAAIIIGFKFKSKAARLYGLGLSMFSAISVTLFNSEFDSTFQLAGGIILCGILCFAISFVYSRAAKILDDELEKEQE